MTMNLNPLWSKVFHFFLENELICEGVWALERGTPEDLAQFQSDMDEVITDEPPQQLPARPLALHFASEEGFQIRVLEATRAHKKLEGMTPEQWTNVYLNPTEGSENGFLAPQRLRVRRKCGVPLEQQVADRDCCHEVIQELMESVWNESYESLGCQVKQDIVSRVSHRCMLPPGMTDFEIRMALAEEIANCQEWADTFQNLVN